MSKIDNFTDSDFILQEEKLGVALGRIVYYEKAINQIEDLIDGCTLDYKEGIWRCTACGVKSTITNPFPHKLNCPIAVFKENLDIARADH